MRTVRCLGALSLIPLAASAAAETLGGPQVSLTLMTEADTVHARLESAGMTGFASGPYVWQATLAGANVQGLTDPRVTRPDAQTLLVRGRLGPLEVEQRFMQLEDASGFREVITLRNPGPQTVPIDDIRTGFSRQLDPATDPYRLVAVPYRRQADGSTHDYSMADVARVTQQGGKINAIGNRPPVMALVDEELRRLRSESWILTDANHGLLVLKYNNEAVEHSAVDWHAGQNRLVFGGCAFVLHREPVQANALAPGASFTFGETRYVFFAGGWPEGYALYKDFLNQQGHGLVAEYVPQVQWNILFDLGDRRWSREKVLEQARLAQEVGCTRIYFDPGWQVPVSAEDPMPLWGSALWDEPRLGSVEEMVSLMRDSYGLELGLWTASRVRYDSQWPRSYYRQIPAAGIRVPTSQQGRRNLALLPEARATSSPALGPNHSAARLNDGFYGHEASWIAGRMPAWVELDLGRVHEISEISLGNDHTQKLSDRATTAFRILTATSQSPDSGASPWQVVAEYQQYEAGLKSSMRFTFAPISARWVRIELLEPTDEKVRIDEIEVYESRVDPATIALPVESVRDSELHTLDELCMSHQEWQAERFRRLARISDAGVKFLMLDFHGWNGPCHAPDHGHAVPSTTLDHIESLYTLARKLRQRHPDLRIEMHDAVWPWGARYLPGYFRQGLRKGDYDENWGYEFMWNSIEDIRSGKAASLYYYNLAYDVPMYLHFNLHADNDQLLAFWWMASTIRHLGFGGRTNAARMEYHGKLEQLSEARAAARFDRLREAMATYNRLKPYFTHGQFSGIGGDESLHLHTLPDRPGGVLLVFNLGDQPITRTVRLPLSRLNFGEARALPRITGASGSIIGDELLLQIELGPESPGLIEIGLQFP